MEICFLAETNNNNDSISWLLILTTNYKKFYLFFKILLFWAKIINIFVSKWLTWLFRIKVEIHCLNVYLTNKIAKWSWMAINTRIKTSRVNGFSLFSIWTRKRVAAGLSQIFQFLFQFSKFIALELFFSFPNGCIMF